MKLRTMLATVGSAAVVVLAGLTAPSAASATTTSATTSFACTITTRFATTATFSSTIEDRFGKLGSVHPMAAPLCRGYMDYPHISTGGRAVVAKGRFVCDGDAPPTDVDAILVLWVCSRPLPANYSPNTDLNQYGCVERGSAHYTFPLNAGDKTVRYVPPNTDETRGGAHGNGYWPACMGYKRNGGVINNVCSSQAPHLAA